MIPRKLASELHYRLSQAVPAVVLLGPRQVGKTTLARQIAASWPQGAVYLDLELPSDRRRLDDAEAYLRAQAPRLVVIDEIHRAPELFAVLRGLIDERRAAGQRFGHFLLLGSAALDLMRQSSETLAGRVAYLDMAPVGADEAADASLPIDQFWQRGGFPDSLLAADDALSFSWRQDFIRSYLERDVPMFAPRMPAETLGRLWTMLAHQQGGLLNQAQLAGSLGVSAPTVARYVDLLSDLHLVRRLMPWSANVGKRLVKSPKVYVRDSGLVHALLHIGSKDDLLSHPVVGASWEGFCVENLIACAPSGVQAFFYRSSGGAEVDLLLQWPNGERWAIEIKRSTAPKLERGFHSACEDLQPARKWVVYPGMDSYRLKEDVTAMPLHALCHELQGS